MNNNDQVDCAPLLSFLRLACTRNVIGDGRGPVARPVLKVPLADTVVLLTRHHTELVEFKLPGLNRTPILGAGQQVAQSLGELVAEQRAACQDVINRHALSSIKTIDEYFGASTHTLLCQVPNTVSLPPAICPPLGRPPASPSDTRQCPSDSPTCCPSRVGEQTVHPLHGRLRGLPGHRHPSARHHPRCEAEWPRPSPK
jgi:hypothetical protein